MKFALVIFGYLSVVVLAAVFFGFVFTVALMTFKLVANALGCVL